MNEYLLWLDFETNGRPLKDVEIIEVGWILTDRTPQYNILNFDQDQIKLSIAGYANMPKVVFSMHMETGLLTDVYTDPQEDATPVGRIDLVDAYIYNTVLKGIEEDSKITLAGSGVSHFDITLLREKMPLVYDILHGYNDRESGYLKQTFDIGVVRRFMQMQDFNFEQFVKDWADVHMPFPNEVDMVLKPHRALYDCFHARAEALTYTNWIRSRNRVFNRAMELERERKISEAD